MGDVVDGVGVQLLVGTTDRQEIPHTTKLKAAARTGSIVSALTRRFRQTIAPS